jgi:hypothetical protein
MQVYSLNTPNNIEVSGFMRLHIIAFAAHRGAENSPHIHPFYYEAPWTLNAAGPEPLLGSIASGYWHVVRLYHLFDCTFAIQSMPYSSILVELYGHRQ